MVGWADSEPNIQNPLLTPDAVVQGGISNFIYYSQQPRPNRKFSKELFNEEIDQFFSTNGSPDAVDLMQILLMYGGEEEAKINPVAEGYKRVIIYRLSLTLDPKLLVDTVAPILEQTTDKALVGKLEMALNGVFAKTGRYEMNQPVIGEYLDDRKENPPYGLIRYMYKAGRVSAVNFLGEVYGDGQVQKYTGMKRGAEIESIARGGHWWEELYVAEKLKGNKKLIITPEAKEKLKNSSHRVVKATMDEIN